MSQTQGPASCSVLSRCCAHLFREARRASLAHSQQPALTGCTGGMVSLRLHTPPVTPLAPAASAWALRPRVAAAGLGSLPDPEPPAVSPHVQRQWGCELQAGEEAGDGWEQSLGSTRWPCPSWEAHLGLPPAQGAVSECGHMDKTHHANHLHMRDIGGHSSVMRRGAWG